MAIHYNISVFDYNRNKLCDLYDSQYELDGQAFEITHERPSDGVDSLTFSLPYQDGNNFRWDYMRNEYLIRLAKDNKYYWFVANNPSKNKSSAGIIGTVSCESTAALLKTKNIYMEFDDSNGIGTLDELLEKAIVNTGWTLGYVDPQYEPDGTTEKVRSISTTGRDGSLELVTTICNIFKARPVYDTDQMVLNVYSLNNHENVFEVEVGKNLDSLNVDYNSKDIITRLYVEGEYGDFGYVGIDDVNPTGLSYLLDFDYFKELGIFTDTHEQALQGYLTTIKSIKSSISSTQADMTVVEDIANDLLGQCKIALYYVADGFTTPKYLYGTPSDAQARLGVGDEVVVLKNNQTHRYETITSTPQALIQSGDYGIAKFVTACAGQIGSKEIQIDSKEKEIENIERKIERTTRPDSIAEYRAEIADLEAEIQTIYTGQQGEEGLYGKMYRVMEPNGILSELSTYTAELRRLNGIQDTIEADFIIAMGDMLRDGYWQNQNYAPGCEQALYNDALDVMKEMSRPRVSYELGYSRSNGKVDISFEDIGLNDLVRVHDEEMDVHDTLFVQKISDAIDNEMNGSIEISNQDILLNSGSLGQLLSRMSQLSNLIEQKNALYERAKAITANGTMYTDRLNGQIDVLKNQILSSVSNWYTDEQGNMIFLDADGGSAVMLSGSGMLLADGKTEDGEWNWRTAINGHGVNADEIVAGFISAERIESGSIATSKLEPDAGEKLVLSNNPAILGINAQMELLPDQIITYVNSKGFGKTFVQKEDPATEIDPATGELKNTVEEGDHWFIPKTQPQNWEEMKAEKWNDSIAQNWGGIYGYGSMYVWHNGEWSPVYDQSEMAEAYTRITQTSDRIKLEAVRAKSVEERLEASIILTAREIQMNVASLDSKTRYLQDDGHITLEAFTTSSAREVATRAGITLDANGHILLSAANFDSLGGASSGIRLTPTSITMNTGGSMTVNAGTVDMNGGSMNIKTNSSLNISGGSFNVSSGAVNITGGSVNIKSGGNLVVEGGSITVKSTGTITVDGGSLNIPNSGKFALTSTNLVIGNTGIITSCVGGTFTNVDAKGTIRAQQLYIGNTKASLSVDANGKITSASLAEDFGTRITQNSTNITLEATRAKNAENALSGRIDVQANKISLVVSGSNTINAASIVAAINGSASSVVISADHVQFNAPSVSISDLDEWYNGALNIASGTLNVGMIFTSYIDTDQFHYQGDTVSYADVVDVNGRSRVVLCIDSKN